MRVWMPRNLVAWMRTMVGGAYPNEAGCSLAKPSALFVVEEGIDRRSLNFRLIFFL